MQKKQNRLAGLQNITFGLTAVMRRNVAAGIATLGMLSCFAWQVLGNSSPESFWLVFVTISSGMLVVVKGRNHLEINFNQDIYYIETGSWPTVVSSGGRLRDIASIAITKDLQFSEISYATFIEFKHEVKREPYRLDFLPCSVPIGSFADRVALYVELAERLNVPLNDDSGWNGWRPDIPEPKRIVILPGETHPVLLQSPKKWKKW
jgi:hypothetical protein